MKFLAAIFFGLTVHSFCSEHTTTTTTSTASNANAPQPTIMVDNDLCKEVLVAAMKQEGEEIDESALFDSFEGRAEDEKLFHTIQAALKYAETLKRTSALPPQHTKLVLGAQPTHFLNFNGRFDSIANGDTGFLDMMPMFEPGFKAFEGILSNEQIAKHSLCINFTDPLFEAFSIAT